MLPSANVITLRRPLPQPLVTVPHRTASEVWLRLVLNDPRSVEEVAGELSSGAFEILRLPDRTNTLVLLGRRLGLLNHAEVVVTRPTTRSTGTMLEVRVNRADFLRLTVVVVAGAVAVGPALWFLAATVMFPFVGEFLVPPQLCACLFVAIILLGEAVKKLWQTHVASRAILRAVAHSGASEGEDPIDARRVDVLGGTLLALSWVTLLPFCSPVSVGVALLTLDLVSMAMTFVCMGNSTANWYRTRLLSLWAAHPVSLHSFWCYGTLNLLAAFIHFVVQCLNRHGTASTFLSEPWLASEFSTFMKATLQRGPNVDTFLVALSTAETNAWPEYVRLREVLAWWMAPLSLVMILAILADRIPLHIWGRRWGRNPVILASESASAGVRVFVYWLLGKRLVVFALAAALAAVALRGTAAKLKMSLGTLGAFQAPVVLAQRLAPQSAGWLLLLYAAPVLSILVSIVVAVAREWSLAGRVRKARVNIPEEWCAAGSALDDELVVVRAKDVSGAPAAGPETRFLVFSPFRYVVVPSAFFVLPRDIGNAFLAHEDYHYRVGWRRRVAWRVVCLLILQCPGAEEALSCSDDEFRADEHAARVLGTREARSHVQDALGVVFPPLVPSRTSGSTNPVARVVNAILPAWDGFPRSWPSARERKRRLAGGD